MTRIWVPSRKLLVVEPPNAFKIGVAGYYKLDVLNPDKTLKRSTGWFRNLITNNGLDVLCNVMNLGLVCVGSSNTPPAFSDVILGTQVASTTNSVTRSTGVQASAPYYGWQRYEWQFPQGAAAGNLTEVGVGNSSVDLISRALILDGLGNPTSITVLANEFLNVTYELRMYVPTVDVTGSVVLSGTSYNYTIRASRANTGANFYGWLPVAYQAGNVVSMQHVMTADCIRVTNGTINAAVTGNPSGTSVQNGGGSSSAYSAGTYSRAHSYTWGINDGNLGGAGITAMEAQVGGYQPIGSGFQHGGRGSFQIGFSAAIPKDNTKQLTLNFATALVRV